MIPHAVGRGEEIDANLGERVRAMRIERNLSQEGLAGLCPPYTRAGKTTTRTGAWLSNIETGKNEPAVGDLIAIASALQVDVRYLLMGEQPQDSEFIARLRGMEPLMDERGRRLVLRTAAAEVEALEEERRRTLDLTGLTESQIASVMAVPESVRPMVAETMRQSPATDPGSSVPDAQGRSPRSRRAGRG